MDQHLVDPKAVEPVLAGKCQEEKRKLIPKKNKSTPSNEVKEKKVKTPPSHHLMFSF